MKKVYSKPAIIFESFAMSTNIAGDCDTIITNQSRDVCAYQLRTGENVFTNDVELCTTKEADGDYNGICYHVPINTSNLFTS